MSRAAANSPRSMSQDTTPGVQRYRPSLWIRVVVGATVLVFAALTAVAFRTGLDWYFLAVAVGMLGFSILVFVETFIARLDIEGHTIAIKSMFRTTRIALADVQKVSAEGGRTSLLMKSGSWTKLPEWIGSNMSVRRRVADRLKG